MNTSSNSKNQIKPWQIIGGTMGWLDEVGLETNMTQATQVAKGFFADLVDLTQTVAGTESKEESKDKEKLAAKGSIEFNKQQEDKNKKQKEADRKKLFFQAFKEDQERAQKAKDKLLLEDEINDIVTNLPTDQKNQLLHYQRSYRDRSIYQRAELRKKLIEEQNKQKEQNKQETIKSPAKQVNAMDAAFEGGSGKSGSGSANFSSTGGGAG